MGGTPENIRDRLLISPECRERFLPMEAPCAQPLRLRDVSLGGVSELRGAYEIGRAAPNFHVLLYTLDGGGELRAPGLRERLEPGTLLVAPAKAAYEYELTNASWRILWFHLRARETWRPLAQSRLKSRLAPETRAMESAAEGLIRESASAEPESARAAWLYAELLELLLRRAVGAGDDPAERARRRRLADVWEQVEASLDEEWTIERLARAARMSRSRLHEAAREGWGASPMRVVAGLRMRQAERLLRHEGLTVAEAAARVGYENPFAFSAAYKRLTGKTPGAERR